jgi:hypothetical protein
MRAAFITLVVRMQQTGSGVMTSLTRIETTSLPAVFSLCHSVRWQARAAFRLANNSLTAATISFGTDEVGQGMTACSAINRTETA